MTTEIVYSLPDPFIWEQLQISKNPEMFFNFLGHPITTAHLIAILDRGAAGSPDRTARVVLIANADEKLYSLKDLGVDLAAIARAQARMKFRRANVDVKVLIESARP